MKSRQANFILLPLVGIIWVLVGLRFIGSIGSEEEAVDIVPSKETTLVPTLKDSFQLVLPKRDPFLGRTTLDESPSTSEKNTVPGIQLGTIKVVYSVQALPQLRYKGFVHRATLGDKTGILSINGRLHTVQAGDTLMSIKVLKLEDSAITLVYKDTVLQILR